MFYVYEFYSILYTNICIKNKVKNMFFYYRLNANSMNESETL